MAEDYSATTAFPAIQRVTLSGTPDNVTQVLLPTAGRKVTVLFETTAGKVAAVGTDAAAINADYFTVPADSALEIVYGIGVSAAPGLSLYLGSGTASQVVGILMEGKADLEERS